MALDLSKNDLDAGAAKALAASAMPCRGAASLLGGEAAPSSPGGTANAIAAASLRVRGGMPTPSQLAADARAGRGDPSA